MAEALDTDAAQEIVGEIDLEIDVEPAQKTDQAGTVHDGDSINQSFDLLALHTLTFLPIVVLPNLSSQNSINLRAFLFRILLRSFSQSIQMESATTRCG